MGASVPKKPPFKLKVDFLGFLQRAEEFYVECSTVLEQVADMLKAGNLPADGELCDTGYLMRETAKTLDTLRKEIDNRQQLLGRVLALKLTKSAVNDPDNLKVKGEFSSGAADMKMVPAMPRRGTPEWSRLFDFFGVDQELAGSGVLSLHWNHMVEYVTKCIADGKQVPPGITSTYPDYKMIYRRSGSKLERPSQHSSTTKEEDI